MSLDRLIAAGLVILVTYSHAWAQDAAQQPPELEYADQADALAKYTEALREADRLRPEEEKAFREKIIDLCLKLPERPGVPEEATRHFLRGATFAKLAKSKEEFRTAALEYREGLKLAPCTSDGYYNYALILEVIDEVKPAIDALQLYLRAAPNASDAAKIRSRIYELEAKLEFERKRPSGPSSAIGITKTVPGAIHIPFARGSADANAIQTAIEELKRVQPNIWGSSTFLYEPGRLPATIVWDVPFSSGSPENGRAKELVADINSRGGVAGRKLLTNETSAASGRTYLGVTVQPVTVEMAPTFGLEKPVGALVAGVDKNSPAEEAGLQSGDVILDFAGKPVNIASDLVQTVRALSPGTKVNMRVWRNGTAMYLLATVRNHP